MDAHKCRCGNEDIAIMHIEAEGNKECSHDVFGCRECGLNINPAIIDKYNLSELIEAWNKAVGD